MFERRLKIILALLCVVTFVLVARAFQVQVIEHQYWVEQAADAMKRERLTETTRGRLLDFKGRVIAEDDACIDACVDYRVIPREPDADWVADLAKTRVRARRTDEWKAADSAGKKLLLADEVRQVGADINTMWATLANVSGKSLDDIDDIRNAIVLRVAMRQRSSWYHKFVRATTSHTERMSDQPAPWYRKWLVGDDTDAPQLDQFDLAVAEQTAAHVILRNISPAVHNALWKRLDHYPGLVLRPSTDRKYPFNDAACHVIGNLGRVLREDIDTDPNVADPLRQYLPNDERGRSGLEALCEPLLRGRRGRIEESTVAGKEEDDHVDPAEPGKDVRTSIDIDMERDIADGFKDVRLGSEENGVTPHGPVIGACVVLDIPTGQVRAMVSVPTFDLNTYDERYAALSADYLNRPLMNRATQFALPPGSTVKPMVGLGAITQGVLRPDETIECTGYLKLHGRTLPSGRCWTMQKFHVGHHQTWPNPHPTGFLTYPEALERSCNVFFETVADRLGVNGLHDWLDRFGLGRPTGIGIAEVAGNIPGDDDGPEQLQRFWFAGIGQSPVSATPLQMANVAATIARGGVWVRPTLLADADDQSVTRAGSKLNDPDRVDLHLSPAALSMARQGMISVVYGAAGTGPEINSPPLPIKVACKTGTAQVEKFSIIVRDPDGTPRRNFDRSLVRDYLEPNTPDHKTPEAPWYRGSGISKHDLAHAWYIGFAPADNPKIAFAAMVEYGGSGGYAAAGIDHAAIAACLKHGYLTPDPGVPVPVATTSTPVAPGTELLHDAAR